MIRIRRVIEQRNSFDCLVRDGAGVIDPFRRLPEDFFLVDHPFRIANRAAADLLVELAVGGAEVTIVALDRQIVVQGIGHTGDALIGEDGVAAVDIEGSGVVPGLVGHQIGAADTGTDDDGDVIHLAAWTEVTIKEKNT